MKEEAISLGWRCESAQIGVNTGIRGSKKEGYKTCPFDLHNSNYIGVCKCIEDDFKNLTNPKYLELIEGTFCSEHFSMYEHNKKEIQIVNTYYNFIYNHESPGHGNLYLSENWKGGINHFVDNNFKNFIERYNKRVENFMYYINNMDKIYFILMRYNSIPYELSEIISKKYPNLNFEIHNYINYSPYAYSLTKKHTTESIHEWEIKQWEEMNIKREKYPEEFQRYERPLMYKDVVINDNKIKIFYF